MTDLIDSFSRHCLAEGHYTHNTMQAYESDLLKFENDLTKPIDKTTNQDIKVYLQKIDNVRTKKRKLASLKRFFLYLRNRHGYQGHPTSDFRLPMPDRVIKILTKRQISKFIESIDSTRGLRNKAMIMVLLHTGVTADEATKLVVKDLDLDNRLLSVSGTYRERLLPLDESCAKILQDFIRGKPHGEYLFPSKKPYPGNLSRKSIWRICGKLSQDMPFDVTPRILRNSYLANLMKSGADKTAIQELGGFLSIDTVDKFVRFFRGAQT